MTGWILYAPFNAYGEPDDLKRFVNACHGKGLAVLLDVVYNHLGPVGNYLGKFGPYFTDHHSTPWGGAINFEEAGATEVRRFLIDNALMWLARLPHGRTAPGCGARIQRPFCDSFSGAACG